jgi:hypothetical protein
VLMPIEMFTDREMLAQRIPEYQIGRTGMLLIVGYHGGGYVDDILFLCYPRDLQRPGRKVCLLLRITG